MTKPLSSLKSIFLFCAATLALYGCAGGGAKVDYEDIETKRERKDAHLGKLFGSDPLVFGESATPKEKSGIGVSAYLWRATLDTLSFMPLSMVDPFGGVILTDWHSPANAPQERLKVDVRILTKDLRSDGLKVSVFRQKMVAGQWVTQTVSGETHRELEEAILRRARALKSHQIH